MADLHDDLILEIIARLPLKQATQCLTLNRNIRAAISHSSFHRYRATLHTPAILHFCNLAPAIFSRIPLEPAEDRPTKTDSVNLPSQVQIIGSCNGVLLLTCSPGNYLFNPVSGGILSLASVLPGRLNPNKVGLVVDSGIKVVILRLREDHIRFDVVAVSDGSVSRKALRSFTRVGFSLAQSVNIRPVYAYGCVHWIERNFRRIISLDVAAERPTMIPGPLRNSRSDRSSSEAWFGAAQNRLQFLLHHSNTVTVFAYDNRRYSWQATHRVQNICSHPEVQAYRNGRPLFFDGRRLFLLLRKVGQDGVVWMYDLLRREWRTVGIIGAWTSHFQGFLPFLPTTEKVSDEYLQNSGVPPLVEDSLRQLQLLLGK